MAWFALGLGLGLLLGVAAGAWALRRHLRTVRAAERRARGAERMAEIGSMTSGLAHEIKNPLSTIGLNAQLLGEAIDELVLEPEARARLTNRVKALGRETERLRGILTDFLEFAGQVRLDARPTDLHALTDELVDFFQPEAERQGVRIRADHDGGRLMVHADARLVKQALLNLMLNATQAMAGPGGGQGAPSPRAGERGELIVRTRRGADEERRAVARVHVIDTGPGIAPDVLPKVFQPYFTSKAGGSGLGLPTARRLIEAHGGRLDVHSEVGKGSDFCVVLPVEAGEALPGTGGGVEGATAGPSSPAANHPGPRR
ncbi:MAG: two-component sensor histidine kinase [Phycisphaerae bacterium]|nr:two-component sensor histidine kinase [Phycisphaerae bacterium]